MALAMAVTGPVVRPARVLTATVRQAVPVPVVLVVPVAAAAVVVMVASNLAVPSVV